MLSYMYVAENTSCQIEFPPKDISRYYKGELHTGVVSLERSRLSLAFSYLGDAAASLGRIQEGASQGLLGNSHLVILNS